MGKTEWVSVILIGLSFLIGTHVYADPSVDNVMEQALSTYSSKSAPSLKVISINRKFNFIVVSQGLGGGLRMGESLKVLSQGQEVAMAKIVQINHMYSVADLIEMDPKQPVLEGDEIQKAS